MKKSLLIGALSAAALLVGGTVAAFVVTDNAGAKTATIQIGTIEGNVVTLEWGDVDEGKEFKTSFANLLPGEAQSLGNIKVKASGKDAAGVAVSANNPYTGYLDLSLDENYGGRLSVFAKEVGKTEDLVAVTGTAATLKRYSVEVASEKEFEIFVQLSGVVTNQDIAAVSGKEATLTVDWRDVEQQPVDPGEESEIEYYLIGKIGGEANWNTSDLTKLTKMGAGDKDNIAILKGVNLTAEDEVKIIYADAKDENADENGIVWLGAQGGGNFVISATGEYDIYLNNSKEVWCTLVSGGQTPVAEKTFHVVGTINDWTPSEAYVLTLMTGQKEGKNQYESQVFAAKKDDKIKVRDSDNLWYPDGMDNDYVFDKDGNYKVYFVQEGGISEWTNGYFYVAEVPSTPTAGE